MAEAALYFLAEHVEKLRVAYQDVISDADKEFEELKNALDLLKAFLKNDVPKQPNNRHLVREMERQIIEVVYEVEDTIDSCMTQAAASKSSSLTSKSLKKSSLRRSSLAKQIKLLTQDKVKPMLDKAKSDFSDIKPAQHPDHSITCVQSEIIRADLVVGLKDMEDTIINDLWEKSEEVKVISIIGMPGLGKTTLAYKIFGDPRLHNEFPTRIWIHACRGFDRKAIFLSILKHFTHAQSLQLQSDEELVSRIRECLENVRFLLVFDNVWSVEDWNILKGVLPRRNGRGKVVITSSDSSVGRNAGKSHTLRFLSPEESWELLQIEVFGRQEDTVQELEDVGRRIAEKCDGLPLALITVGGVLKEHLQALRTVPLVKQKWETVCGDMQQVLQRSWKNGNVGTSYEGLDDEHMRECFLYMGVFPKGYPIPAPTLIRLWIAEGMVPPKEGSSLEETAVEYLEQLICKNLVVVDKRNRMDEVKRCGLHSMVLAFCRLKAREQNLFQEIRMSESGEVEPPISEWEMHRFRRLSLHPKVNVNDFLLKNPVGSNVRSLLYFSEPAIPFHLEPDFSGEFNLLRVLDPKFTKFQGFPLNITKLIHLRYLTLSIDDVSVIPEAVSKLWNLQTLVVDTNAPSITMKANMWRMVQLRHLKTNSTLNLDEINFKPESATATAHHNLQTITTLSPDSCKLLSKMANLRTLGIRGKLRPEALPQLNCFPKYLKRLTLSKTFLHWKHISTLAKIETLEVLKLKHNAFTGESWTADGEGFKSLQFLLIVHTDLVRWDISSGYLPTLRVLVLNNCEKLTLIPLGLARYLELLEIDFVGKSVVDCANRIDEAIKQDLNRQKILRWGSPLHLKIGPGCF